MREQDYLKIAPQNSFIAASNFKSPKALADYLKYLDTNMTKYMEYFAWHMSMRTVTRHMTMKMCGLCAKLHNEPAETSQLSSYSDIYNWWHTKAQCKEDYAKELAWYKRTDR